MFEATDKKKRTCATSSSTGAAVDTGDTVRHAPGREQYMRLAKKEKKSLVLVFKLMINAVSGILNSQVDCFVCFIYQKKKNLIWVVPTHWNDTHV